MVTLAIAKCLDKPSSRVLFLAPFAKDASEIATDVAEIVLRDCPVPIKPEFKSQTKELHFKNGSVIRFKGVNGEHAQFLRGAAADLIILDECGIMDDLKHVVSDICMPMLLTTNGHLLLCSTPARSPGHESYTIFEDLAGRGATSVFTIRDAPHFSDAIKCEYLLESGEAADDVAAILAGTKQPKTTTVRREYFCEWVTDADTAVLPEFTAEVKESVTKVRTRPPYFTPYVSMDPGFNDRTGILFGYYDFRDGILHIEDEKLLHRAGTPQIAEAVHEAEVRLWGSYTQPRRVSDIDLRLIADLFQLHGLQFSRARKEDSLGAINLLRTMIGERAITIDPRCVHLLRQMTNATWDRKAKDFDRNDRDGHYDLLAALKYMCRFIDRHTNPYPVGSRERATTQAQQGSGMGLMLDTPFNRRLSRRNKR